MSGAASHSLAEQQQLRLFGARVQVQSDGKNTRSLQGAVGLTLCSPGVLRNKVP